MSDFAKLSTDFSKDIGENPWNVYPRPKLKRDSFYSLNGKWDFEVSENPEIPRNFTREILVPFCPESILSGIDEVFSEENYLFYKTEFSIPADLLNDRIILHFGAVDGETDVFLNGKKIGDHVGGYDPFEFDITEHLREKNVLAVRVSDRLSEQIYPYGKQCKKRGGMWYTPVSGIWQTVWLEGVPKTYVKSLSVETGENFAEIFAEGIEDAVLKMRVEGKDKCFEMKNGRVRLEIENPSLWSPENPFLYHFEIEAGKDRVSSYFALRTIENKNINGKLRICLNGKPYFFHGLLDQGYWSDSLFTPATPEALTFDILEMKRLGFNTLRKHIKIEPEQFYYDCDRLGMIVFQDMINNSDYNFLRDTALPTVGIKKISDKHLHKNKKRRKVFEEYMYKTVKLLKNHPSVCYWTIFNEGWGQFCGSEMYRKLKKLDDTRIIDTASGWFSGVESDVVSEHVYFKPFKFKPSNKLPTVLSEFGGYSYRPEGHIFNLKKAYGYKFFEDREEFQNELIKLYENEIIPAAKNGLSGAIYTQVSDVEDETNGLLSYDRKVLKVDREKMLEIAEKLKDAVL